ncbi:MAG: hypothetical protein ABIR91_05705 [Candidatus Saccharimonadales bacterium]
MAATYTEENTRPLIAMTRQQFTQVIFAGMIVGAIAWGLTWALDAYVYQAILCRGDSANCASASNYSLITASILAAASGLFALVRLQVFRPLLVVLASTVSLWSLPLVAAAVMPWYFALVSCTLLFGLAYGAFAWLARVRSFILSLVAMIVVVAAVRFVLYS